MTWHDQIREAREALGISQSELAKRAHISQAAVAKIEKAQVGSTIALSRLIRVLGLNHKDFPFEAFGKGREMEPTTYEWPPEQSTTTPLPLLPEFARDPAYWAAAAGLVGDVPLYASAEGGDGSLIIERDPIGTVKRPPLLQGIKEGYAIYLVGESMSPEFEPGDVLMVNPRMPVIGNTSCVFYNAREDEPKAMVKRFLSADTDNWHVRQFCPLNDFDLRRSDWPTRHRVVSKNFR